jgi:DNA-directed RNA polymerase specialized sigma24 family protein
VKPFVSDQGIDAQAKCVIQHKARRLIGKAGFNKSDLPDIEQEMTLKLFQSQAAYDPARSKPGTFVKTVAERKGINLLRDQQARGRSKTRHGQLSSGVMCHAITLSSNECPRDLQMDVQAAIAQLSPIERDLCHRLMHVSFSQAARSLGVPRSTLQNMVRRLADRLEAFGLSVYAPNLPVNSAPNRVSKPMETRSS